MPGQTSHGGSVYYNTEMAVPSSLPASPSCHLYSDASGSYGCGAFGTELVSWSQLQWPHSWLDTSIAAKELVPIALAAAIWGHHWLGKHIRFHSDNDAVMTIIENQNARYTLLIQLLRCLFFYASVFQFTALHTLRVHNVVADAISRNNLTSLHSLIPQASRVTIPQAVSTSC